MSRESLVSISLLISLAGCNEYNLLGKDDDALGSDDTDVVDLDGDGIDDIQCDVVAGPGFDASVNEDCENEIETGTFNPVVEYYYGTFSAGNPSSNQIMSTPVVGQLTDDDGDFDVDNDDMPDIVVVTFGDSDYTSGGTLRAISGDGSKEHWAVSGTGIQGTGGAAIGDIDADGKVDIVALKPAGAVAFEADGRVKWNVNGLSGHISGISDVPSIVDMNHDGAVEIVAGRAILDGADGTLRGAGNLGMGGVAGNNVGTCSFAVDVDGDALDEVITGNASYDGRGNVQYKNNSLPDGYPAVGNFDSDPEAEIVVSGQGELRLLNHDYTVIWRQLIPGAGSSYYGGPPTVADFDGDGEAEIGVAAGSRYSVFEADGSIRWQAVTDDSSSGNTGSSVFDFEGDGVAEVVYADQTTLWVFSGVDGSVKLASSEHSNGTWLEYPVVADVDGDGHANIVVPNTAYITAYAGFHVFGDRDDSWQPGRKIWNQHAYFITNVEDDGGIPKKAASNWLTYNNFRSGDVLAGAGTSAPDLVLAEGDICEIDCEDGVLFVQVHVGNQGAVEVLPSANPVLSLYARVGGEDKLVASVPYEDPLVPGRFRVAEIFEISELGTGIALADIQRLKAEIISDELECDVTNNTLILKGPFCD